MSMSKFAVIVILNLFLIYYNYYLTFWELEFSNKITYRSSFGVNEFDSDPKILKLHKISKKPSDYHETLFSKVLGITEFKCNLRTSNFKRIIALMKKDLSSVTMLKIRVRKSV